MRIFQLIKISLLIVTLFCTVVSCKNDNEPTALPESFIEDFNQTDMSFSEEAGEQTFSFKTNGDWEVDVASTSGGDVWCKASPTEGKAGSQTVKITTTENDTYDDRSVTVTLKSGDVIKTFVVTQKQKDAILINSNKIEVGQKGGTITIEVKANVNYTATIGETCKDWITESNNTRALSSIEKKYSIALNEYGEKREGTITFTSGDISETVHVYQTGGDIILLSKNEYYVDAAGENITVELRSDCKYEVEMPTVNWIHTTSSRSISSHTLYYTIDANDTYNNREAKIVYHNKEKNVSDTLTIIQAQKDAIILGKKEITVKGEGGTIEVKLSTNVDYEVEMPNVDWITTKTTCGEHTLYYEVAKNENYESRSARITFINKDNRLEEALTLNQEGIRPNVISINVSTAGDLPKITERRDFEALKLTGYLNGTDIRAIREMNCLEYLDISETHIVEGGEYYGLGRTENNTIGAFMFYECDALKQILLPNSVTTIGDYAFCNCRSLTSINIPNGVTTIGQDAFKLCTSLTSINIPDSVTAIGNAAFEICINLTSINIPNGVTTIGNYAFCDCRSLTSINISNGVTTIGDYAFSDCINLTSINIPDGVTTIGDYAFYSCISLSSINIPNGLTTIGDAAFRGCSSLTSINIPDSVTTIGYDAFVWCTSLTSINISNGVTTIREYAFYGCTSLTIVKIGTGIDISSTCLLENASVKKVYCYTTIPPESQKDDFTGIVKSEAELYIPKGTYQTYSQSNWGTAFDNIIEMED